MSNNLSSLTLSIIIALSSNAYANALPNTTPQPTNPTIPTNTSPTPIGLPTPSNTPITAANSHNYTPTPTASASGGKTGVFGKIVGNIKKVTKPNPIEVGITLGVAAVSYVMTNSEVQKLPQPQPEPAPAPAPAPSTGCKVEFGSTASHSPLGAYIAGINSRTTYNGKGNYTYNVSGESIDALTRAGATALEKYSKTNKAVPLTNLSNTNIRIEVTDPNNKKFNHYINTGVFVSCVEPAPQPEENPQDKPQEQPQPQPQPVPVPAPVPSPTPNNDPNADPNAQPSPSPNGQPSPATTPEEYEFNLDFEFPAFCDWAKVVCDFITDDVATPKPPTKPNDLNLDNNFKMYIDFGGSCPANKPISFKLMNRTLNYSFPYHSFCDFFEKISFFLVGFTYLAVATFILKSL